MHRSLVLTAVLLTCAAAPSLAGDSPAAERCRKDLDSIPAFLLANDTGAPEHLRHHGEATLERALADARAKAGTVADDAACLKILNDYLSAWRHGHLAVSPAVGLGADGKPEAAGAGSSDDANPTSTASTPTITWLSAKTVLLTVPTFHPDARKPLEALLTSDAQKLRQTPNWIIDLRRNDGGSDETYEALTCRLSSGHSIIGNWPRVSRLRRRIC